jgi:type I restriction enzyme, S subunit
MTQNFSKTLGEICRPRQWPTLSKKDLTPNGYPVYGANGKIGFSSLFTHERPTLLIGCRGSCGTVHITEAYSYANGNAMALDDLDEDDADIRYLYHFFSRRGFRDVTTGTSQPQIIQQHLRAVEIPLPPLEEQRRIAVILDRADKITSLQQDANSAIHHFSRNLYLSHFGDPRVNPHSWPEFMLMDLGRVVTGSTPPSSENGMFDGDIPFITPGDLGSGLEPKRSLTDAGALKSRTVGPGSALVCCIGATIGKMDIAKHESAFNQQINAVDWGDDVIGEFGIESLRFLKETIATTGASTTLPILKKSSFEKLRIPVPPIDMQRDYCRRLKAIDSYLARLQTAAQLGTSLKQALMVRVFSGELKR